jgi:hypothetical protein
MAWYLVKARGQLYLLPLPATFTDINPFSADFYLMIPSFPNIDPSQSIILVVGKS